LLGLRSAPKEISNFSSAEAVYGQQLVLPGEGVEVAEEDAVGFKRRLASEQPPQTVLPRTWAQVAASPPKNNLQNCKYVFIRKGGTVGPLASLYEGPFEVVKNGLKSFIVKIGDGDETVSVDRLKPYLGTDETTPAQPPKRGRPRKVAS
jgi:hypothetical protein